MTKLTDEAERRYLMNAVFHAEVEEIVQTIEHESGVRFDQHDRSLATLATACALHRSHDAVRGAIG